MLKRIFTKFELDDGSTERTTKLKEYHYAN